MPMVESPSGVFAFLFRGNAWNVFSPIRVIRSADFTPGHGCLFTPASGTLLKRLFITRVNPLAQHGPAFFASDSVPKTLRSALTKKAGEPSLHLKAHCHTYRSPFAYQKKLLTSPSCV